MKIRSDFVTNSSSTSFVIIAKDKFDLANLQKMMGIKRGSPFEALARNLFAILTENMSSLEKHFSHRLSLGEALDDIISSEYSSETAQRILSAQNAGHKIFCGRMSSEEEPIQTFFCCESFELEDRDIYIDATECTW